MPRRRARVSPFRRCHLWCRLHQPVRIGTSAFDRPNPCGKMHMPCRRAAMPIGRCCGKRPAALPASEIRNSSLIGRVSYELSGVPSANPVPPPGENALESRRCRGGGLGFGRVSCALR
ncbi:hypothetical protein BV133_1941 [Blastochloris viridis]|uniref:Uncharacterized protein n=1 Tax=Blastochloris viridis TaxID=1079 RepID=A0A182D2A7_BLAVI|nr:hypothetical protein BV133_1941 [Blastochloris viridis]